MNTDKTLNRHSREGGNLGRLPLELDSRLRGNDEKREF